MTKFSFPICLALSLAIILQAVNSPCKAGGFANLDLGSTRCARMGIVADCPDLSAVFHNPACLADQKGNQVYLSMLGAKVFTTVRLRYPDGSISKGVKPKLSAGIAPLLGVSTQLNERGLIAGIAVYCPNFYGASLPDEAATRYHAVFAYFVTGYVTPTLAYRINEHWAVGGGVSYIYVILGEDKKFGDYNNPHADPDNDWKLHIDGHEGNYGYTLGVTYTPFTRFKIGLSYVSESHLTLKGAFSLTPPEDSPDQKVNGTQSTKMPIPQTVRLGFQAAVTSRWEAALDLSYFNYSIYKVQETTVIPTPPFNPSSIKDYSDSWNLSGGVMFHFKPRIDLMMGLQYDWSPIPLKAYSLDNPTSDLYGASIGMGFNWTERSRIVMAYVHNEYAKVDVHNSITFPPTNGIGKANNNEISIDYLYRF